MGVRGSYWLLAMSGGLAALGVVQLLAIAAAPEPLVAALAAFAALVPAGYFLGLFAARPRLEAAKPLEPSVLPEGESVVVPFRRRVR
jgi:hypothetical protein